MNTSRLLSLIESLLEIDSHLGLQAKLVALRDAMRNYAGTPGGQPQQAAVAQSRQAFIDAASLLSDELLPTDEVRPKEIDAWQYFKPDIGTEVLTALNDNAALPHEAASKLSEMTLERGEFIDTLKNTVDNLRALGVKTSDLEPGEAEVGFVLPRLMFHNDLPGLITELREINKTIRIVSEVTLNGEVPPVKVKQISTSDPSFFFDVLPHVAVEIGKAVSWAVGIWHTIEQTKKARAETKALKIHTEKELAAFYDEKIKSMIQAEVEKKVDELTKGSSELRVNEQKGLLRHSLNSLIARTERGMTVEVNAELLPEPQNDNVADGEGSSATGLSPEMTARQQELQQIRSIGAELRFPPPSEDPILQLASDSANDQGAKDVSDKPSKTARTPRTRTTE